MRFNDIIGQREVINKLVDIADSGRVAHAMLFKGENGHGPLALALAFVQYLNCQNRQHYGEGHELHGDSCGECPSCRKINQLMHGDLQLLFPTAAVDAKTKSDSVTSSLYTGEFREWVLSTGGYGTYEGWMKHMGVEKKQGMIREKDAAELLHNLSLKPLEAPYKASLLWMAEKMNGRFANEILKTLEEPSSNTVIVMVTENDDLLLPTVVSRMQMVVVPRIDNGSLLSALQGREGVAGHEEEVLSAAEGSMANALNYLDARSADKEYSELFVQWMRKLFKLNMAPLSQWVEMVHGWNNRELQKQFLMFSQDAFRACFLKTVAGVELSHRLQFGDEKFNNAFPAKITHNNIEAITSAVEEAIEAIDRNCYAKIVLMQLSFTLSSLLKKA